MYATLGSKVDVVEMTPGLLPGADRDLIPPLQKRLEKLFSKIMLNTAVTAVKDEIAKVKVTFKLPDGTVEEKSYDKVLVSVGRRPNSKIPGLENTKVKVNERGFISVNKQLQTDDPAVYAIGDVAGDPMLAHKASHEGRTAMEHIAGHKVEFAPYAIPAVVFTDPEIAWAGLTQTEAEAKGMDVEIVKFPWAASGRAVTLDRTEGLTKLLIDKKTERVLGGAIVGPGAGDMIAEIVLAIEMAATAYDLGHTIHPHPDAFGDHHGGGGDLLRNLDRSVSPEAQVSGGRRSQKPGAVCQAFFVVRKLESHPGQGLPDCEFPISGKLCAVVSASTLKARSCGVQSLRRILGCTLPPLFANIECGNSDRYPNRGEDYES